MSVFVNLVRVQAQRCLHGKEWKWALLLSLVFVCASYVQTCLLFWGADEAEIPSAAVAWVGNVDGMQTPLMGVWYTFLVFLLAAAVFSDRFFLDVRSKAACCASTRSSLSSYVGATALVTFVSGCVVTLISLLASQALAYLAFPVSVAEDSFATYLNVPASLVNLYDHQARSVLFPCLFYNHRALHNLLFAFYASIWAGIMALASLALSLYVRKNRLIVLGVPTVAYLLFSYVMPHGLSLSSYLYPNYSTSGELTAAFFVGAPVTVLLVVLTGIVVALRGHRDVLL